MKIWILILVLDGSGKAITAIEMATKDACVLAMKAEMRHSDQYCLNRETGEVVRP